MPGQSRCRACHAAYSRAYKRTHSQRYDRKQRARITLGKAVKSGKLKVLPCRVCGSTDEVQAHHKDYSKPLEVVWLCRPHHLYLHHGDKLLAFDVTERDKLAIQRYQPRSVFERWAERRRKQRQPQTQETLFDL